jgi:hypothetical protein
MAREKISPEELSIEPLSARFNLSPFDSGDDDLNEFLMSAQISASILSILAF